MPGTPPTTPRHAIPRIASTDTDDVPRDLNAAVDRIDVTAPVFISGTAASRPAAGIADRYHYATDTGELTRDTGTAWTAPLNPRMVATVTSLPGAPYDGQVIDYLADGTAGILWRLRYRASSASAYKWETLGGSSAMQHEILTTESRANTAYGDLTTVGPQVTVPLAGEYDVYIGAGIILPAAAAALGAHVSIQIGATAAVDNDAMSQQAPGSTTQNNVETAAREMRRTVAAAATTVKMMYRTNDATNTCSFWRRRIAVRPVRVG